MYWSSVTCKASPGSAALALGPTEMFRAPLPFLQTGGRGGGGGVGGGCSVVILCSGGLAVAAATGTSLVWRFGIRREAGSSSLLAESGPCGGDLWALTQAVAAALHGRGVGLVRLRPLQQREAGAG